MHLIENACNAGARFSRACAVAGYSPRTIQRYRRGGSINADGRKAAAARRVPANRLKQQEVKEILRMVNKPEYAHLPPSQIVPLLADKGIYLASESTIYRILRAAKQLAHRTRAKAPVHKRPKSLQATGANQLWSWDITYMKTTVRGQYYYLYLLMDIFSRKIVGWEVYPEESAQHAADVFSKAHLREKIGTKPLVLHSDNGSPMKGATMLGTLQKLGVVPSFSRPSVSNDNAYSEALFKTMKYRPGYPSEPFASIEQARTWVSSFVQWYNEEHRHSAINFVTPAQRHQGIDRQILKKRQDVYRAARDKHPHRWTGQIRNWDYQEYVTLNPQKSSRSANGTQRGN